MKTGKVTLPMRLGVGIVALLLALVGCGGGGNSTGGGGGAGEDKEVTLGVIQGWTDYTSTAALMQVILEEQGWKVKVQDVSDNAPMYTGLAKGDIDVLTSSWKDRTHASYWEEYGKDLTDVGSYYEGASLFLAAPDYSNIKSIEDLPAKAGELGDRIVGIEPGAGLTKITQEKVMPDYGLDTNFKLVLSSTTAMLAELKKATAEKKPIVVTLWKPFWANQAFPVQPLADPKKAFGDPENLHVVANKEYADAHPNLTKMLAAFKLTDEQYGSLEDTVVNKFGKGEEDKAAKAWLEANPGYADKLVAALNGTS
jgi:glycine betaine/proline transport system substrate-binding protein